MNHIEAIKNQAGQALERGDYQMAVAAASALIEAGEPWLLDGLVRRAMALENWGKNEPERLNAAADDWKRLVEIAPAAVAYCGLARVYLELGDRRSAYDNLREAEKTKVTPEVLLGLAQYHRTAEPPDLEAAKTYFLRAALRGRTQGMRGYVEVAYELDRPYDAAVMVLAALVATPFLALMMGERRHMGF